MQLIFFEYIGLFAVYGLTVDFIGKKPNLFAAAKDWDGFGWMKWKHK